MVIIVFLLFALGCLGIATSAAMLMADWAREDPELDPFYVEAMRELDILDGTVLPELPAAPVREVLPWSVNERRALSNVEIRHLMEEWCLNDVKYSNKNFGRNYAYKKSL